MPRTDSHIRSLGKRPINPSPFIPEERHMASRRNSLLVWTGYHTVAVVVVSIAEMQVQYSGCELESVASVRFLHDIQFVIPSNSASKFIVGHLLSTLSIFHRLPKCSHLCGLMNLEGALGFVGEWSVRLIFRFLKEKNEKFVQTWRSFACGARILYEPFTFVWARFVRALFQQVKVVFECIRTVQHPVFQWVNIERRRQNV